MLHTGEGHICYGVRWRVINGTYRYMIYLYLADRVAIYLKNERNVRFKVNI